MNILEALLLVHFICKIITEMKDLEELNEVPTLQCSLCVCV